MTLSEYIQQQPKRPLREWAECFGISISYVQDLMQDRRAPSLRTMQAIRDATNGAVTMDSWAKQHSLTAGE